MSNITFDMPIDRTVTVITDGRNITNNVSDMKIADRPDPICEKAKEQFLAYFDGGLKEFSLPYDISGIGTPFFRSILTAVQKIPYGERVTYMQAAESSQFGIGQLRLESVTSSVLDSRFYGRQMVFTVPDFKTKG